MSLQNVYLSTAFLLGLLFGSFANVLILRLKSGKKGIVSGHSECPQCHHRLGALDLIPVLSWLWLRGRCRYCRKAISWQYPLVELGMGLLWAGIAALLPFALPATPSEWLFLSSTVFIFSSLLMLAVFDLKYLEIPDQISLPVIALLGLFLPFGIFGDWKNLLLGAVIPLIFFGLQILLSKGRWMGGGDLRLGAIMGLLLGWPCLLVALFLAYLTGGIVGAFLLATKRKKLQSALPFGPFLIAATFVSFFWGEALINWYLNLLGF